MRDAREGVRDPGESLPSKKLMGICRWMGSHFYDWIDYNGVAFSTGLLEWGRIAILGIKNTGRFAVQK